MILPPIEWKPINAIMYELTQLVDYLNEINIGHALGLRTDFTMFQLCCGTLIVTEIISIFKGWGYEGNTYFDEMVNDDDTWDDIEDAMDISSAPEYDDDDY